MKPIAVMRARGATSVPPVGGLWYEAIVAASGAALVFDVNDISSLYQDEAGTVPVTAAGQTVKAIHNKGTGGGFATSATGATLTLDATTGKHYIVPPATNRFQMTGVTASLLGRRERSAIAVGQLQGNTANWEFLFQFGLDSDGNYNRLVMANANDAMAFAMFAGGPSGAVLSFAYQSGVGVYIGTHALGTTDTFTIFKGNVQLGSNTDIAQSKVVSGTITLGDYTTSNAAPIARLYSLVIVDRVITSEERASAVAGGL